jgi:hypothetical protein
MTGQPYPQSPQSPKKGNGCLIALAIVGGVLLICGALGFFLCVKLVDKGKALAGVDAPGAKELVALGCRPGLVMDLQAAAQLFGVDAAAAGMTKTGNTRYLLSCTAPNSTSAPTCDAVKTAYLGAVPAPGGRFMAIVQVQGEHRPACQKLYEPTGEFIQDLP